VIAGTVSHSDCTENAGTVMHSDAQGLQAQGLQAQ
jgi:hypothetical protein